MSHDRTLLQLTGGGVDPSRGSRIFVYGVCRGDTSGMVLCYCTLQRYCVLLYYLYRNRWYSVGTVMNECDTYRYTIWIAFSSAYNVVVLATPPPRSRSIAYRGRSSRVRYLLCYIGTARRIIIMLCKHILYKKNVDSDVLKKFWFRIQRTSELVLNWEAFHNMIWCSTCQQLTATIIMFSLIFLFLFFLNGDWIGSVRSYTHCLKWKKISRVTNVPI